ncbi:hypothetical protein E2562_020931 [Oryza meyeriana var. granulata]|uniref:Pentacotripeptide-repeat region of PRORP domain-containing protein n=1 Tax=Oryza meyeriana var. granulata TaxID=110450 RepID=A0A6G1DXG2_9ORYZ|nr:hypothetical protein E2562_020931 [Oryza meyeriana var. granulata]
MVRHHGGVPGSFAAAAAHMSRCVRRSSGRAVGARFRPGIDGAEDARRMMGQLLRPARPKGRPAASARAFNGLLAAAVARGAHVLAVSLFNRAARAHGAGVAPTVHTYGILVDCGCRAGSLGLAFAAVGRIVKAGWRVEAVAFTSLIKRLCAERRVGDAMDLVLRRMPELGCAPNVVSYNAILKGLCVGGRSQEALDLLHAMDEIGGDTLPDVVSYSTIMDGFFKEGEVHKAYGLLQEMQAQGISPNVVTYNSIVAGFCKAQMMEKAEKVLDDMVENGVMHNIH